MKYVNIIIVCFAMIISGCEQKTIDVSRLVAERDSIKEVSEQQQQELDNLNTFVGAVSMGLDSIAMQEHFLREGNPEGTPMTRAQMSQSLGELAQMLARQRARIAILEDSLKMKGTGAENLRNIIAYLNDQLELKEQTISQLKAELSNKNVNIANLQTRINTLNENVVKLEKKEKISQQILATQSDMMNECYMKIGTKKQLKQAGILNGKKLNPNALNPDRFIKVDIRQLRELPINSKKPKILTAMPQSSYSIVRNADGTSTLSIKDPALFWSTSNYLVISLN